MVSMEVLRDTFEPHMHPEAARRMFNFIYICEGRIGIGGGYRAPGRQPNRAGFAPPGKSFHEGQDFASGRYYCAWDLVAHNPGRRHRAPTWDEVPKQDTQWAMDLGVHCNVSSEPWHLQPIEIDGWGSWDRDGRPEPVAGYEFITIQTNQHDKWDAEPAPESPNSEGIKVEFTSRTLKQGHQGPDVKFYQGLINDLGSQNLVVDGDFGPQTARGVRNWQTYFGLTVDAVLGPVTQRSIIEVGLLTS